MSALGQLEQRAATDSLTERRANELVLSDCGQKVLHSAARDDVQKEMEIKKDARSLFVPPPYDYCNSYYTELEHHAASGGLTAMPAENEIHGQDVPVWDVPVRLECCPEQCDRGSGSFGSASFVSLPGGSALTTSRSSPPIRYYNSESVCSANVYQRIRAIWWTYSFPDEGSVASSE